MKKHLQKRIQAILNPLRNGMNYVLMTGFGVNKMKAMQDYILWIL
jgi:hypothetical protein